MNNSSVKPNFYEEITIRINELIVSGNYHQALVLVCEELSMPYIPTLYEKKFHDFLIRLQSLTTRKTLKPFVSLENIKSALTKPNSLDNNYRLAIYLRELSKFNYRLLLHEINFFLNIEKNNYLQKSFLLIELIKMEVTEPIFVTKNKQQISICPNKYSFNDLNSKLLQEIVQEFHKRYYTSDPQLFDIAVHAINYIDLYIFPFPMKATRKPLISKIINEHLTENLTLSAKTLSALF